jgi:hypothetical protein
MAPWVKSSTAVKLHGFIGILALLAAMGAGASWKGDEDLDPVPVVHEIDENCPDCLGHGRVACRMCNGNGMNPALTSGYVADASDRLIPVTCPRCHGDSREPCLTCFGSTRAGQ